jgi:hypothetical protein
MRYSPISLALVSMVLAACGEEAPPPDPELPPLVGALEIPISLRNADPAPSNALRIEMSPTAMHVDGHALYEMTRGEPPDSEQTPEGYTQLRARVASLPARGVAALTVHAVVPYGTFVRTLQTLTAAGYHEFAIAVRSPDASPVIHWMTFSSPELAPATGPVAFPGTERPWEDFTQHWGDMYASCRTSGFDCSGTPTVAAQGGHFQLVLWARGQGMVMRFNQVDVTDAGVPPSTAVAMIPGVPRPSSGDVEPPTPIATGAFSFRAEVATQADSAMSATMRPVCGAAVCPTIIEGDVGTNFMRVASMIGAAFPSGSTAPRLAFRIPER